MKLVIAMMLVTLVACQSKVNKQEFRDDHNETIPSKVVP